MNPLNPDPRKFPLLLTEIDVSTHPYTAPALLPVAAPLVHPLAHMFRCLCDKDSTGVLYRGIEMLLVAIDEKDPIGEDSAIQAVLKGWLMRKQNGPVMRW